MPKNGTGVMSMSTADFTRSAILKDWIPVAMAMLVVVPNFWYTTWTLALPAMVPLKMNVNTSVDFRPTILVRATELIADGIGIVVPVRLLMSSPIFNPSSGIAANRTSPLA